MDVFEISIGKLVMSLGILGVFVVDPQMPLAVFGKAMALDELILLLRRRLVFAPGIALVEHESSLVDEFFCMLECASVKCYGHRYSPVQVDRLTRDASFVADKSSGSSP